MIGREVEHGGDIGSLYTPAVDLLLRLRQARIPRTLTIDGARSHTIPDYDADALHAETDLLLDWFLPAMNAAPVERGCAQAVPRAVGGAV